MTNARRDHSDCVSLRRTRRGPASSSPAATPAGRRSESFIDAVAHESKRLHAANTSKQLRQSEP
jgi:hypothetical protein